MYTHDTGPRTLSFGSNTGKEPFKPTEFHLLVIRESHFLEELLFVG